jgi:hypothetical protein
MPDADDAPLSDRVHQPAMHSGRQLCAARRVISGFCVSVGVECRIAKLFTIWSTPLARAT